MHGIYVVKEMLNNKIEAFMKQNFDEFASKFKTAIDGGNFIVKVEGLSLKNITLKLIQ